MHLRLALRHFGYVGDVATFPDPDDPDLLACIHLGNRIDVATEERALFEAIGKRRTNRQAFEKREVPEDVLIALQEAAHTEGAWFYIVQGEEDRNAEDGEDAEGAGVFGGCDVIAMATHGYSGLQRWAMGSVTERVLHATRLPLLIVRPSDMLDKGHQTQDKTTITGIQA